jgi:hypothetical protein
VPEIAIATVPLSFTDQAEGGERPLPGTDDGSGGGTVVPVGVVAPESSGEIVVPPGAAPDEEDEPPLLEPEMIPLAPPEGSCGATVSPPPDEESPGDWSDGPDAVEPVTTPVESLVEGVPFVVDDVTVTDDESGSLGVVTPTDGELGGGGAVDVIVPVVVSSEPEIVGGEESSGVTVSDERSGPVSLEIVSDGVEGATGVAGGESSLADCSERNVLLYVPAGEPESVPESVDGSVDVASGVVVVVAVGVVGVAGVVVASPLAGVDVEPGRSAGGSAPTPLSPTTAGAGVDAALLLEVEVGDVIACGVPVESLITCAPAIALASAVTTGLAAKTPFGVLDGCCD